MTRIRKTLTFSNVVAFVALFVALGGSVYAAGKISGSQIKPNSLPGNRVKAKTLTAKQIKPGTLTGAQIHSATIGAKQIEPNSITGAQINQSTLTAVTASSITNVQYAVANVSISSSSVKGTTGTANCPAGTSVIGGGATVNDEENAYVNDSGPLPSHGGWTATGFSIGTPGNTVTITAICTPVK